MHLFMHGGHGGHGGHHSHDDDVGNSHSHHRSSTGKASNTANKGDW
jgi:hypothetical protein